MAFDSRSIHIIIYCMLRKDSLSKLEKVYEDPRLESIEYFCKMAIASGSSRTSGELGLAR